jgi:hypothetical protein
MYSLFTKTYVVFFPQIYFQRYLHEKDIKEFSVKIAPVPAVFIQVLVQFRTKLTSSKVIGKVNAYEMHQMHICHYCGELSEEDRNDPSFTVDSEHLPALRTNEWLAAINAFEGPIYPMLFNRGVRHAWWAGRNY